jgi:hypothetical protein
MFMMLSFVETPEQLQSALMYRTKLVNSDGTQDCMVATGNWRKDCAIESVEVGVRFSRKMKVQGWRGLVRA